MGMVLVSCWPTMGQQWFGFGSVLRATYDLDECCQSPGRGRRPLPLITLAPADRGQCTGSAPSAGLTVTYQRPLEGPLWAPDLEVCQRADTVLPAPPRGACRVRSCPQNSAHKKRGLAHPYCLPSTPRKWFVPLWDLAQTLLTKIDICAVVAVAQVRMDLGVNLIVNKTNGSVAKRHIESSWMSASKLTKA